MDRSGGRTVSSPIAIRNRILKVSSRFQTEPNHHLTTDTTVNERRSSSGNATKNVNVLRDYRAGRAAHNGLVAGSSPAGPTNDYGGLLRFRRLMIWYRLSYRHRIDCRFVRVMVQRTKFEPGHRRLRRYGWRQAVRFHFDNCRRWQLGEETERSDQARYPSRRRRGVSLSARPTTERVRLDRGIDNPLLTAGQATQIALTIPYRASAHRSIQASWGLPAAAGRARAVVLGAVAGFAGLLRCGDWVLSRSWRA